MSKNLSAINDKVREAAAWIPLLQQEISRFIIGQKYLVDRLILV